MLPLLTVSLASEQLWIIALALGAVVLIVVTALLQMILVTARRIHRGVADIWTGGKLIAANTVNVVHLKRTNFLAAALLASASSIAAAAQRIRKATQSP